MDGSANRRYDVAIVGSGAGGSAVAYALARAGRRVLLLEAGPRLPEDGTTVDVEQVLARGAFKRGETWADGRGRAFSPDEFFNLGGKTRWYGAALLRFGRDEFGADAARGFRAWPFAYEELEPWYAEAEQLLGLRAFDIEPGLQRIARCIRRRDRRWHVRPLRLALSDAIGTRRDYAARFDGFALPEGYKGDAQSRLLDRVAGLPNLTILTGTPVATLAPAAGDPRRVDGVVAADGRMFRAGLVVLAAGALHSPRILQRYLADQGLAGSLPGAAQVGRHYKRHVLTAMLAFSWRPQEDLLRKTLLFRNRRYPHSSVQPLGGQLDRDLVRAQFPRFVPRAVVEFFARRVYGFFLQTEDGSHADNRVQAANGAGHPVLDYAVERTPAARREHGGLVRSFAFALLRAGLVPFWQHVGLAGSAHSAGTLAAGARPQDSAVDPEGRVHGLENVYVADGSVLPRIGRYNPALTIYAWGLRLAHRLQAGSHA